MGPTDAATQAVDLREVRLQPALAEPDAVPAKGIGGDKAGPRGEVGAMHRANRVGAGQVPGLRQGADRQAAGLQHGADGAIADDELAT